MRGWWSEWAPKCQPKSNRGMSYEVALECNWKLRNAKLINLITCLKLCLGKDQHRKRFLSHGDFWKKWHLTPAEVDEVHWATPEEGSWLRSLETVGFLCPIAKSRALGLWWGKQGTNVRRCSLLQSWKCRIDTWKVSVPCVPPLLYLSLSPGREAKAPVPDMGGWKQRPLSLRQLKLHGT